MENIGAPSLPKQSDEASGIGTQKAGSVGGAIASEPSMEHAMEVRALKILENGLLEIITLLKKNKDTIEKAKGLNPAYYQDNEATERGGWYPYSRIEAMKRLGEALENAEIAYTAINQNPDGLKFFRTKRWNGSRKEDNENVTEATYQVSRFFRLGLFSYYGSVLVEGGAYARHLTRIIRDRPDGVFAASSGAIYPELEIKGCVKGFNEELESQGKVPIKVPFFFYSKSKQSEGKRYQELIQMTANSVNNILQEKLQGGENKATISVFDESRNTGRTIFFLGDLLRDAVKYLKSEKKIPSDFLVEYGSLGTHTHGTEYPEYYRPLIVRRGDEHVFRRVSKRDGQEHLRQEVLIFKFAQLAGEIKGRLMANVLINGKLENEEYDMDDFAFEPLVVDESPSRAYLNSLKNNPK
ncbi:MAG TPA: hypothetical protein VJJ47_01585 [Candidatus Paceibacterota bacterium]